MAKNISKRQWEEIRSDFEKGMTQAELRKKYDLSPSTLGTKIKRDGWRLSHDQTATISEFKEVSAKISESYANANATQQEEIVSRVNTILEDNQIVQNNRKLMKMAQNILVANKDKFNHQNIRNLTGAIKDMEQVSNPRPDVQVNTQVNTQVNLDWDLI